MASGSLRIVEHPVEATSLLADLRNFTPLLNGCPHDSAGVSQFCHFLGDVYSIFLGSCITAIPPGMRHQPPLLINPTGDGVLAVFTGDWHFGYGFLAAILLDVALERCCEGFNLRSVDTSLPRTSFGIGVESGSVTRIQAQPPSGTERPVIDAFIGQCINVAARAEGITKTLDAANTVISDETVELAAQALFGENFRDKRVAEAGCGSDDERVRIHKSMGELNRRLCLAYINRHVLKGVERPMPLYRLARSSLDLNVPRFNELVTRLVRGEVGHRDEVFGWMQGRSQDA